RTGPAAGGRDGRGRVCKGFRCSHEPTEGESSTGSACESKSSLPEDRRPLPAAKRFQGSSSAAKSRGKEEIGKSKAASQAGAQAAAGKGRSHPKGYPARSATETETDFAEAHFVRTARAEFSARNCSRRSQAGSASG